MTNQEERLRVLFLCTGNSCRSQMAEGWARALKGDEIEAHSAGIESHGLNPSAVPVMDEAGIDISGQRSKTLDELAGIASAPSSPSSDIGGCCGGDGCC